MQKIDVVTSDITPEEFFEKYVSKRKPGLIFICVSIAKTLKIVQSLSMVIYQILNGRGIYG